MSIFDIGKACTFSAMSGVILNNGEPVKHAVVKRETHWQKEVSDETTTDENGYFEFPVRFERSIAAILPQEFVVGQSLFITYKGNEYKIWAGVKRKKHENSETSGGPIQLTCELNQEREVIFFKNQAFITQCKWNVVPEKLRTGFE